MIEKREAHFSGPLPHPEHLARFEEIQPGLADRIVKMAESEQLHDHAMQELVVRGSIADDKRGMWMSFVLASGVLGGSFVLARQGQDMWALAVFVSMAGVLIARTTYGFIQRLRGTSDESEKAQMTLPAERPKDRSAPRKPPP